MLDRLRDYADCLAEPGRWAIATIVEVSGSVPLPAGTSMAVREDGLTIGSVSGGCVEGAVVDAAIGCLESGVTEVHSFGYADDDGMSVGLMCGGDVRVLVQPLQSLPTGILRELANPDRALRLVRELPPSDTARNGGMTALDAAAAPSPRSLLLVPGDDAADLDSRVRAALDLGGMHVVEVQDRAQPECPVVRRLVVESTTTPARLVIYGANDFSAALAHAAAALGRHVTVCDARPVFATRARHPGAHEVVVRHPAEHFADETDAGRLDPRTAIVVLTHDPRYDLPVLDRALRADLAFVGAMGSRATHEKRVQELRAGGLTDGHLARLHSPIGLDLGARTPAEVAVSILAELIMVETAARSSLDSAIQSDIRTAPHRMLRDTAGDVHDASRVCGADPHRASAPTPASTPVEGVPAWM